MVLNVYNFNLYSSVKPGEYIFVYSFLKWILTFINRVIFIEIISHFVDEI